MWSNINKNKKPPLIAHSSSLNQSELLMAHLGFCNFSLHEKGYSPETIKAYKHTLNSFLGYFRSNKIEDICEEALRQWLYKAKQDRGWSNNTVRYHIKNFSPFLDWCVKNHYLKANPLKNIEKPKLEDNRMGYFSKKEVEQLMYAVHEYPYSNEFLRKRNYAILSVLLLTGVRRGELLGLKLADIRFDEKSINIRAETSKSRHGRVVPMSQRLHDILLDYLEERQKLNKTTLSLFTSCYRDMGITKSGLRCFLEKLQEETGIHVHAHKFRHTYTTIARDSGIDLIDLQENLGHKRIETTRIYAHTSVESRKKSNEKNELNLLI